MYHETTWWAYFINVMSYLIKDVSWLYFKVQPSLLPHYFLFSYHFPDNFPLETFRYIITNLFLLAQPDSAHLVHFLPNNCLKWCNKHTTDVQTSAHYPWLGLQGLVSLLAQRAPCSVPPEGGGVDASESASDTPHWRRGGVGLETSVFWCCVENWKHRKTCISLKTYFILFHTFNSKQRARLQQPQRRVDPILPAFVRWAEINQDCHQKAETCTEGWEAGMFAADQSLHNKDPCANTPVIRSWCLTLSAPSPTALSFHGVSCLFSQDVWPLVERLKFNLLRKDPKHERGRLAGLKLSILGGITGTGEWFVGKTVYLWADLSWSVHKHKQWEAVIPSQTLLR